MKNGDFGTFWGKKNMVDIVYTWVSYAQFIHYNPSNACSFYVQHNPNNGTFFQAKPARFVLSIHVTRRVVVLMYPADNQLRFMKLLLTWCSISTRWGLRYNPTWKKYVQVKTGFKSSPQIGVKIKHNLKPPPKSSSTFTYTIHGSHGLGALVI